MSGRLARPVAEAWLPELATLLERKLSDGKVKTKAGLHKEKSQLARSVGASRMPQDPELLPFFSTAGQKQWAHLLRKKPMRSQSGVAIVAVMSSPAGCPHGKCIYCPGGPDVDAPQSYTGFEPSTMRAKRFAYDSYRIVRSRLHGLEHNGHSVDKVEVIVQGGTFPAREDSYQDWFIAGIYAACNDGPHEDPEPFATMEEWDQLTADERGARLTELQRINETAPSRVIGLTVETKPDWCFEPHIDAMLRHGATRIELGIQTLSDEVTALTNRGHSVQDGADALRIARDAGFKVCVHMMPGLPRPAGTKLQPVNEVDRREDSAGAAAVTPRETVAEAEHRVAGTQPDPNRTSADAKSPAAVEEIDTRPRYMVDHKADIEDMRQLFENPDWRPDMLKIYPTLIVAEGETTLKRWWREGRFEPLDTEGAVDVVAESFRHIPEYCRIQRIDRDIPTTHVLAGVLNSNLRQLAEAEAIKRGIKLRDIRAREAGTRMREGIDVDPKRLELVRRDHEASGSTEVFLSMEDPQADALVGFLRLRRVGQSHRTEFNVPGGSAVVRELKVYGTAQALGAHDEEAGVWQHQGLGGKMLDAAEEIAREWGVSRLLVIAGPGVKEYYRRHGYTDVGPYVAKSLI